MAETWHPGTGASPRRSPSRAAGTRAPYLLRCHPDRLALLRPDDVLDRLVPGVAAEADGGGEEVAAVLLHLAGLGVEAPGALPGVGRQPLAHGLDALPALGLAEHHHRVVLHVVEALHG